MNATTRLEVLDPTVEPIPMDAALAPRPKTLDGTALGLLANGKRNADVLLEMLREILSDRYEFKAVVTKNKGNASRLCPTDIMDEMAELCDVVISASGD